MKWRPTSRTGCLILICWIAIEVILLGVGFFGWFLD